MSHDTQAPTGLKTFDFAKEMLASYKALRRLAISLTRNTVDADDYVQETFMKALANREKFTPGTNMAAWLSTILRNEFYSRQRKAGREVGGDEKFWAAIAQSHAMQHTHAERMDVRRMLENLPPGKLKAIVHSDVMGLTIEEQADAEHIPQGTVKSRVSRARAYARNVLEAKSPARRAPAHEETPMLTKPDPFATPADDLTEGEALQKLLELLTDRNKKYRKAFSGVVVRLLDASNLSKRKLGQAMLEKGVELNEQYVYQLFNGKRLWNTQRLQVVFELTGATAKDVWQSLREAMHAPAPAPEPLPVAPSVAPPAAAQSIAPLPAEPAAPKAGATQPPSTVAMLTMVVKRMLKERLETLQADEDKQQQLLADLIHRLAH